MPKTEYVLRQRDDLWTETTQGLSLRMKKIVDDKVRNHIRPNPYDSEPLHFELEGLWSYNKMKSDNRIVFAICEDCRKREFESVNNCLDCEKIADNTIMLFAFGGHDIYTWLGRKRKKAWKKAKKKKKVKLRGH
jgi:Txe/YoeB family toxin of Txe-Axe toxin-antitoxin module